MKYKFALTFAAVAAILGAISAQAQGLPSLRPRLLAHAATSPSPNVGSRSDSDAVPASTTTCSYTFTHPGVNNSYMQFCVTANGNIVSFISPAGIDYINQGSTVGEGYGICDTSTGRSYYDYAYTDSGNWGAPVLLALTTGSVKISRSTSDGLFTLVQTITRMSGAAPGAEVTMALKGNGIPKNGSKGVHLVRYAKVNPGNCPQCDTDFYESFDSTVNAAWGYTAYNYTGPEPAGYGLMLEQIGQPHAPLYDYRAIDQNTAAGPDPCNAAANYAGYQASVDGSVVFLWELALSQGIDTVSAKYQQF